MPALPLPLREGQAVQPSGYHYLLCLALRGGGSSFDWGGSDGGYRSCRGLVGEIPHWHPCPGAPARLAVLLPGKWVALGGRCGWVWDEVHRAHPGVSALVVA